MNKNRLTPLLYCALILLALWRLPAQADYSDRQFAQFASDGGTVAFISAGVLLPLARDGRDGKDHALRTADALGVTTLLAEGLKRIVRERRPEGDSRTSFPSEHAATAFSVATAESHFHPKEAPYWYGGAALIAWSRVRLDRHYTHDIVAGAALGYFTTRYALSRPRGIILTPLIPAHGGVGLQAMKAF